MEVATLIISSVSIDVVEAWAIKISVISTRKMCFGRVSFESDSLGMIKALQNHETYASKSDYVLRNIFEHCNFFSWDSLLLG